MFLVAAREVFLVAARGRPLGGEMCSESPAETDISISIFLFSKDEAENLATGLFACGERFEKHTRGPLSYRPESILPLEAQSQEYVGPALGSVPVGQVSRRREA